MLVERVGPESHLCPWVETWHAELSRSLIQHYLNLTRLLTSHRLLIESNATLLLPSIKISLNEPIHHLDRKPRPSLHPGKAVCSQDLRNTIKPSPLLSLEWPRALFSTLLTILCTSCPNSFDGYHKAQEAKGNLQQSPDGC